MAATTIGASMDLSELNPGLLIAAFGLLAWTVTLCVGWIAPASVVGRMEGTVIGLSTICMVVTIAGIATVGFTP